MDKPAIFKYIQIQRQKSPFCIQFTLPSHAYLQDIEIQRFNKKKKNAKFIST